jgi:hypothetical protein
MSKRLIGRDRTTKVASVWNSRRGKPSWPAAANRINRPDIWMQAIRSDLKKLLRHADT